MDQALDDILATEDVGGPDELSLDAILAEDGDDFDSDLAASLIPAAAPAVAPNTRRPAPPPTAPFTAPAPSQPPGPPPAPAEGAGGRGTPAVDDIDALINAALADDDDDDELGEIKHMLAEAAAGYSVPPSPLPSRSASSSRAPSPSPSAASFFHAGSHPAPTDPSRAHPATDAAVAQTAGMGAVPAGAAAALPPPRPRTSSDGAGGAAFPLTAAPPAAAGIALLPPRKLSVGVSRVAAAIAPAPGTGAQYATGGEPSPTTAIGAPTSTASILPAAAPLAAVVSRGVSAAVPLLGMPSHAGPALAGAQGYGTQAGSAFAGAALSRKRSSSSLSAPLPVATPAAAAVASVAAPNAGTAGNGGGGAWGAPAAGPSAPRSASPSAPRPPPAPQQPPVPRRPSSHAPTQQPPASAPQAPFSFPSDDLVAPSSGHRPATEGDLDLESILTSYGLDPGAAEQLAQATASALAAPSRDGPAPRDRAPSSVSGSGGGGVARRRTPSFGSQSAGAAGGAGSGAPPIVIPGVGAFSSAAAMLDEAEAVVKRVLQASGSEQGQGRDGAGGKGISRSSAGDAAAIGVASSSSASLVPSERGANGGSSNGGSAPGSKGSPANTTTAAVADCAAVAAISSSTLALRRAAAREEELLHSGNFNTRSALSLCRRRRGQAGRGAAGGAEGAPAVDAIRRGSSGSSAFEGGAGAAGLNDYELLLPPASAASPQRHGAYPAAPSSSGGGFHGPGTPSFRASTPHSGASHSTLAPSAHPASIEGGPAPSPLPPRPKTLLHGGRELLALPGTLDAVGADPTALLLPGPSGLARPPLPHSEGSAPRRKQAPLGVFPSFVEGHRSAAGILKIERLARVSDGLRLFAAQSAGSSAALAAAAGSASGGPGLPTALAVHPKFIAIGTSRALLLLFDHFGELKAVLGRGYCTALPPGSSASALVGAAVSAAATSGAVSDGAVTAIDVCPTLDYITAGFFSGRVVLFDAANITKCSVLKVAEQHRAPITLLRFVSATEPRILSVDSSGTVNFLAFSRFMSIRWGVECRCVLDGTRAGQIVAVSVLPPLPAPAAAEPASGASGAPPGSASSLLAGAFSVGGGGSAAAPNAGPVGQGAPGLPSIPVHQFGTFVALCTRESTYILVTAPEVAVVHKWPRPADVPPAVVPALAWGTARVFGSTALEAAQERRAAAALLEAAQAASAGGGARGAGSIAATVSATLRSLGIAPSGSGAPEGDGEETASGGGRGGGGQGGEEEEGEPEEGGAEAHNNDGGEEEEEGDEAGTQVTGSSGGGGGTRPPSAAQLRHSGSAQLPQSSVHPSLYVTEAPPPGPHSSSSARQQGGGGPALTAAATAASIKLRSGSTLAPGTVGVVTSAPLPVLARAWGRHLQLLQVQPPGGFPIEVTNLASEAAAARAAAAAAAAAGGGVPVSGAWAPGPSNKVFGSLTGALMNVGNIDALMGGGGGGAAAASGRLLDFVLADDITAADAIAGLTWLSESALAYISSAQRLVLLDTAELEERDAIDMAGSRAVYAAIVGPTPTSVAGGGPVAPPAPPPASLANTSSYSSSLRSCDGVAYLLCSDKCLALRIQGWADRIAALVEDGAWLPALALGADVFEDAVAAHFASIAAAEHRARWAAMRAAALVSIAGAAGASLGGGKAALGAGAPPPTGAPAPGPPGAGASAAAAALYDPARFARLRAGPGPAGKNTIIGDALEGLLLDYVRVMLSGDPAPLDGGDAGGGAGQAPSDGAVVAPAHSSSSSSARIRAAHLAAVAAVAIDFCVCVQRQDLLLGEVFEEFSAHHCAPALLEALEPHIMRGRVPAMPPIVMKAFVEHFRGAGALGAVERCLLHLDLGALDIDGSVRTCLTHRLYSALVYVVNAGLLDMTLPIDVLLAAAVGAPGIGEGPGATIAGARVAAITDGSPLQQLPSPTPDPGATGLQQQVAPLPEAQRTAVGYQLLLYLAYCLTGRVFPSGRKAVSFVPVSHSRSGAAAAAAASSAAGRGGGDRGPRRGDAVLGPRGGGGGYGTAGLPLLPSDNEALDGLVSLPPLLRRDTHLPIMSMLLLAADPQLADSVAGSVGLTSPLRKTGPGGRGAAARGLLGAGAAASAFSRAVGTWFGGAGGVGQALTFSSASASFRSTFSVGAGGGGGGAGGGPGATRPPGATAPSSQQQRQSEGGGAPKHGSGPVPTAVALASLLSGSLPQLAGSLPTLSSSGEAADYPGTDSAPGHSRAPVGADDPGAPEHHRPAAPAPSTATTAAPPTPAAPSGATATVQMQRYGRTAATAAPAVPPSTPLNSRGAGRGGGVLMRGGRRPGAADRGSSGALFAAMQRAVGASFPGGLSPAALRAEALSFLIEPAPGRFPSVPRTLEAAGGLTPGAVALAGLPGPYPRVQGLLTLDPVALLAVLGRLFTAAADATRAAVWLCEGPMGLMTRQACEPGIYPPISAPEVRHLLPALPHAPAAPPGGGRAGPSSGDAEAGGEDPAPWLSGAAPSSRHAACPTLSALLRALLHAALALAPPPASGAAWFWRAGAGAGASQRAPGGGAAAGAPGLGGFQSTPPASGRPPTAVAASAPRVLLPSSAPTGAGAPPPPLRLHPLASTILLFLAFQAARMGPGVPPIAALPPPGSSGYEGQAAEGGKGATDDPDTRAAESAGDNSDNDLDSAMRSGEAGPGAAAATARQQQQQQREKGGSGGGAPPVPGRGAAPASSSLGMSTGVVEEIMLQDVPLEVLVYLACTAPESRSSRAPAPGAQVPWPAPRVPLSPPALAPLSCPLSPDAVEALLRSWDVHSDEELLLPLSPAAAAAAEDRDGGTRGQGGAPWGTTMATRTRDASAPPSPGAPHSARSDGGAEGHPPPPLTGGAGPVGAGLPADREGLLVRLLRCSPLAPDQASALYELCLANGLLHAQIVLLALRGDAPGVVDALLSATTDGSTGIKGQGGPAHPPLDSHSALRYIRAWAAVLQGGRSGGGGGGEGEAGEALASESPRRPPGPAPSWAAPSPPVPGAARWGPLGTDLPSGLEEEGLAALTRAGLLGRLAAEGGVPHPPGHPSAASVFSFVTPGSLPVEGAVGAYRSLRAALLHPSTLTRLSGVSLPTTAALLVELFPDHALLAAIGQAQSQQGGVLSPGSNPAQQPPAAGAGPGNGGGGGALGEVLPALEIIPELQYRYLQALLVGSGAVLPPPSSSSDGHWEGGGEPEGGSAGAGEEGERLPPTSGSLLGVPPSTTAPQSGTTLPPLPADLHLKYVGLLCRFNPGAVFGYLSASTGYPLDTTLSLVRDVYRHPEATAFLLERTGDVAGALTLTLAALRDRLGGLLGALAAAAASQTDPKCRAVGAILSSTDASTLLSALAAVGEGAGVGGSGGANSGGAGPTTTAPAPRDRSPSISSAAAVAAAAAGPSSHTALITSLGGTGISRYPTRLHALGARRETDEVGRAVATAVAVCARNSARYNTASDRSETMWFQLLDALLVAQSESKAVLKTGRTTASAAAGPGGGGKASGSGGGAGAPVGAAPRVPLGPAGGAGAPHPPSSLALPPQRAAHAAVLLTLSECLRGALEAMHGAVPLNVLLKKVLADHGTAEFGEFRDTVLGMMGAYVYERRILATANTLMGRDIFRAVRRLHTGYAAPIAPAHLHPACCVCDAPLRLPPRSGRGGRDDGQEGSGAQGAGGEGGDPSAPSPPPAAAGNLQLLFGCGHAFHARCVAPNAPHCPLCAQDLGDVLAQAAAGGGGGATGTAGGAAPTGGRGAVLDASRLRQQRLGRGGGAGSGGDTTDTDGDYSAARVMSELDEVRTGTTGTPKRVPPSSSPSAHTPAAAATPGLALASDAADDEDPYGARLLRSRETRARGRPLVELFAELSSAAGTQLQVRHVALQTAPPPLRAGGPGDAPVFVIQRRRPALRNKEVMLRNCSVGGVDEPMF